MLGRCPRSDQSGCHALAATKCELFAQLLPYATQVIFVRRLRFEKCIQQRLGSRRIVAATYQSGNDLPLSLNGVPRRRVFRLRLGVGVQAGGPWTRTSPLKRIEDPGAEKVTAAPTPKPEGKGAGHIMRNSKTDCRQEGRPLANCRSPSRALGLHSSCNFPKTPRRRSADHTT
jgi:hypothetical protein